MSRVSEVPEESDLSEVSKELVESEVCSYCFHYKQKTVLGSSLSEVKACDWMNVHDDNVMKEDDFDDDVKD